MLGKSSAEDRWREDTLRQLISIRYESADRMGALHEFEMFAERSRNEMNAEPMPETLALRDIVLRGETPTRTPRRGGTGTSRTCTGGVRFPIRGGRRHEVEHLRVAWGARRKATARSR